MEYEEKKIETEHGIVEDATVGAIADKTQAGAIPDKTRELLMDKIRQFQKEKAQEEEKKAVCFTRFYEF